MTNVLFGKVPQNNTFPKSTAKHQHPPDLKYVYNLYINVF